MYLRSNTHSKRSFSLNSRDFYPLVHIRSLKWMTYEEKVAYRVKHGVPRTIDGWIADGMIRTKAPTVDLINRGPSLKNILWRDDVECILNIIHKEENFECDVQKPDEFTLTLRVRVPPTTVVLMHYWQSPTMIIDQYIGNPHGELAPEWLETVETECRFWQSRTVMLEMMLHFVQTIPQNSRVSRRVTTWCNAMTIPATSLSYLYLRLPNFNPYLPRNTRLHKLRASDLSADESQKARKVLNEGSPLKSYPRRR